LAIRIVADFFTAEGPRESARLNLLRLNKTGPNAAALATLESEHGRSSPSTLGRSWSSSVRPTLSSNLYGGEVVGLGSIRLHVSLSLLDAANTLAAPCLTQFDHP